MDLDDQFRRYFGSPDIASVPPSALASGIERMLVDFGMERDRGRRFGLWTLLHTLGAAPDLDVSFAEEDDRNAARAFMELIERSHEA